jgi:hypothetical protein
VNKKGVDSVENEIVKRRCKCGKRFVPKIKGQRRCLACIMKEEPPEPSNKSDRIFATDFAEWFIYHWRNIRKAAEIRHGIDFEKRKDQNK